MPCALRQGVVERRDPRPLDPSAISADIREGWRELGFLYDCDPNAKAWTLRGSRKGLQGVVRVLRAYSREGRSARDGEHRHHGPYSYFTLVTGPTRMIDAYAISGPLEAFSELADLIEARLVSTLIGGAIVVRHEWAPGAEWRLELHVEDDAWDPAANDPYNVEGGPITMK
jgi:hypothetical protein